MNILPPCSGYNLEEGGSVGLQKLCYPSCLDLEDDKMKFYRT